jgi:beta-galactosidase
MENAFGQGRTLLMGSFPGAGYYLHHGAATRELFAGFLKMAGVAPQIAIDDATVQARLHQGEGGTHLWVTNTTRADRKVTVTLATGEFTTAEDVWSGVAIAQSGRQFTMTVPARDAVVAMLR